MSQQRIIDADGHVMELDDELRDYIGGPYAELEWHRSYGFWPGLTMDGYLRSLRQPGGWVGGGTGPNPSLTCMCGFWGIWGWVELLRC